MLFCGSKDLVKDGFIRGHQRLKCKTCGKRFVYNRRLCDSKLYKEYLDGKQNVSQLAHKYGKPSKIIIRHLEKHKEIACKRHCDHDVILLMDGAYTSNGVCDGLRELIQSLPQYPIQYCQFHQVSEPDKMARHIMCTNGYEVLG